MDSYEKVKFDSRRALPAVDRLAREIASLCGDLPNWAVTDAARRTLASERERLAAEPDGGAVAESELARRGAAAAVALARIQPARVVNATGVVLHTNLGRAPLAPGAVAAVAEAAAHYSDLELDLGHRPPRGSRRVGRREARAAVGRGGCARRQQQRCRAVPGARRRSRAAGR